MQVVSVTDLRYPESMHAMMRLRRDVGKSVPSKDTVTELLDIVGGRLSYLNRVAKARDMDAMAKHMLTVEKGWILSQIGTDTIFTSLEPFLMHRARSHP